MLRVEQKNNLKREKHNDNITENQKNCGKK